MRIHPSLRAFLAFLLISPSFGASQAAAQVVNSAAAASASSALSAVSATAARAPLGAGAAPIQVPSFSANLAPAPGLAPALSPASLTAAPSAAALSAAPSAAAAAARVESPAARAEIPAITAVAAPQSAPAISARGQAASILTGAVRSGEKTAAAPAAEGARWTSFFDGTANRAKDAAAVAAFDAAASGREIKLQSAAADATSARAVAAIPTAERAAKASAVRAGMSLTAKALLAAAIFLATPGIALAATAGAPVFTAAASLSMLASYAPLASAVGTIAGALYGMYAARPKDGTPASSGEVFSSILRYGVLGGAGVYVLLNLTQIAFGASAIGLQPVTSAIAVAALGRTAFQDKFMDPATTSADRVMGAFPAVAAAVGISVGMAMSALAVPTLTFATLATASMAVTGVATALYAALFKPGQSPIDGPARMAKGYVLQALMLGLALAMSNPYLFWSFALMGIAGFGLVLWSTALEIWAHRPGAPAQPLPPVPPAAPAPAPAPTTPAPAPTPAPKA